MDCIFCKILNKEIPANFIYEDDNVVAFNDLNPQAPIHILIIPKQHISTINEIDESNYDISGKMILSAKKIALQLGINEEGYRLVFNCNKNGGQEVFHIHLHLLGGRLFKWPPG